MEGAAVPFFLYLRAAAAGLSIRTNRRKRMIATSMAIGVLLLTLVAPVLAQPLPGSLDISFDPGSMAGGHLGRIVVQPDGRILFADTLSGSTPALMPTTLFRLNSDGTQDSEFAPSGGGLYGVDRIGRIFSVSNGLVRLNSDGRIDPSFSPVLTGSFPLAAELSDGRIMTTFFRFVDPRTQVQTLERLSSDGIVDPGYVIQIATVFEWSAADTALVATPDGGVVLCGNNGLRAFDANGQEDLRVKGLGTPGVWALAIQPDGKLLAGGDAAGAHGPLFRLNSDHSLDTNFTPQVDQTSWRGNVYTIAVEPSGKIVIGGSFHSIEGHPRSGIARLNGDGSLDESFDPGTGAVGPTFGPSNLAEVMASAIQADGNILIGGTFDYMNGIPRQNLARLVGGEIPGPPRAQIPPSDQVIASGAPLALQAWFSGSPIPAYQWLCNGVAIPGATNSSLSVASIDLSQAGAYQLAASNSFGAVTTAVALVSILVPVSNPFVSNAVFQAAVATKTNRTYAAEFADSLGIPWASLTNFPGTGVDRVFQDTSGFKAQRFYRVRAW